MTIPLTGTQYEIEAGDYQAIVTELGAGLRELQVAGRSLIAGYDADELPPAGAGQLLTPWPNRVDAGRYVFDGQEHQLAISEPALGNAIHGLTRWQPWSRGPRDDSEVTLRCLPHGHQGYPFAVEVDITYRVDAESGLHVTVTATNKGSTPAPWGMGSHPYLTAGTPTIDECELELPAARWQPVDDRLIPIGEPQDVSGTAFDFRVAQPLAGVKLDHAFTGLSREADGLAWARLTGDGMTTAMWMDTTATWLQVFTSDPLAGDRHRAAVAIEPMTCPPNAFVSGTDLAILRPRESFTCRWGIRAVH